MTRALTKILAGISAAGLIIASFSFLMQVSAATPKADAIFYKIGNFGESVYSRGDDVAPLQESDKLGITTVVEDFSIWDGSNNKIREFIDYNVPERASAINDIQNVAIRFDSFFTPDVSGVYTFRISGDDGVLLTIGDKGVINFWKAEWDYVETGQTESLVAGVPVEFRLDYLQGHGGATLHVEIQKPGESEFTTYLGEGLSLENEEPESSVASEPVQSEIASSEIISSNIISSDIISSDIISSEIISSEIISSEIISSEVASSDIISSEIINSGKASSVGVTNPATGDDEFMTFLKMSILSLAAGAILIVLKTKIKRKI